MAGHSQFKNIMFRKNKQDAQRLSCSQAFARNHGVRQAGSASPPIIPACARPSWPPRPRACQDSVGYQKSLGGMGVRSPLRGYGLRRRHHRRGFDRQRNRTASDVRAAFPNNTRRWVRTAVLSCSPAWVPSSIRRHRRRRRHAGSGHRAGAESLFERGHEFLCRVEDFAAVRDALEAKLGPAGARSSGGPAIPFPVNDDEAAGL
jgi:hypothetical protein